MNDDHMATLVERLGDGMPSTTMPPDLRTEGERRLRRRRAARGGVIVAAVAIVGAIALGVTLVAPDSKPDEPTALDPGATELKVTFAPDPAGPERGTAWWDGRKGELVYVGLHVYSGSCLAVGSASVTGSTVRLTMRDGTDDICTADAVVVRATITGLSAKPTTLLVTEGKGSRTVAISSDVPGLQVPPQLPTSDWVGGPSMQALAQGRLTVEKSGCVTLGGGTPIWWPKGSSFYLDDEGKIVLLDPSGVEVAREGDAMELGGGFVPGPRNEAPCVGGVAEVFLVQSDLG